MTESDPRATITEWIAAMNAHDTARYLDCFTTDAVLDDPSVGERFEGRDGIADYYERYFIGYGTTTRLISATTGADLTHLAVEFTGDFPGGRTGGIFDVRLDGEKISFVHADLT